MGEKRKDGEGSPKKEKKEKKAKKSKEEKDAKRSRKEPSGAAAAGAAAAAGPDAVARLRIRGLPPGADASKIAAFVGVDVAKVVVLASEATAIMPDAAAASRAAAALDDTKFAGRFVRVSREDFRPTHADDDRAEDVARATARRADIETSGDPPGTSGGARAVEVECAGQTGRIIGKGGAKIREIEELTGCVLRIRQEDGVCEVSGRDVKAAVQEIKNIVQEGRDRDADGGGTNDGATTGDRSAKPFGAPSAFAPTPSRPFGEPPPGSASRHDTGANDWRCACGSVNFARRVACFRCHAPRESGEREGERNGDADAEAEASGGGAGGFRRPVSRAPPANAAAVDTAATKAPAQGHAGDGFEAFVKYLPHDATESEVASFFASSFGALRGGDSGSGVRLLRDAATGRCKGAGFVTFAEEASRRAAVAADGATFGGRHLSISVAKTGTFGVRATEQAAGTHTPAMLRETVDALVAGEPNAAYVDGTFGRGGHSRGILAALGPSGTLHAFDLDPEAIAAGKALEASDPRFKIHHAPFGCMSSVLSKLNVNPRGVFLDLGISSPQFDDHTRGFRPEQDGPLDLRFDTSRGEPASVFLESVPRDELARIIETYGETSDAHAARRIADAIVVAREEGALPSTTKAFARLVAAAKGKEYQAMHPAKLAFQALRIHLNQEFDEFRRGARAAMDAMEDGGRLGVLTWKHSECAILVDFYRAFERSRPEAPLRRWLESTPGGLDAVSPSAWAIEMDDARRPSEREMRENSRSRSAVLHVLRKKEGPVLRAAEVDRAAYAAKGWRAPPEDPGPPPVTFEYDEAGSDDARDGGSSGRKTREKKKEKKKGSRWKEA